MANKQSRQHDWQMIRLLPDRSIIEIVVGKYVVPFIIFRILREDEDGNDEEVEYELCGSCTVDGIVALPDEFGVEVTLSIGAENLPDGLKPGTYVFHGEVPFVCFELPIPNAMRA